MLFEVPFDISRDPIPKDNDSNEDMRTSDAINIPGTERITDETVINPMRKAYSAAQADKAAAAATSRPA